MFATPCSWHSPPPVAAPASEAPGPATHSTAAPKTAANTIPERRTSMLVSSLLLVQPGGQVRRTAASGAAASPRASRPARPSPDRDPPSVYVEAEQTIILLADRYHPGGARAILDSGGTGSSPGGSGPECLTG